MYKVFAIFLGFFAWTFLEYVVHGWMGHLYPTFVRRLHAVHHRDPHAVFAIGAWPLAAAILVLPATFFGLSSGVSLFFGGLVLGFVIYEILHYRIHFSKRLTRLEQTLRRRHMFHHYVSDQLCLGVTSSIWDLVFHTEPTEQQFLSAEPRINGIEPLVGSSNLRSIVPLLFGGWLKGLYYNQ